MRFSSRARAVSESETLRVASDAARLRAEGKTILSLLEGEPDLPVPEPVLAATIAALKSGRTRYSASTGLPELKAAVVRKLREENGVLCAPENVVVANGAKQAVYELLQVLCEPGDEVIIPSPCWVTFPEAVKLAGATPVLVPTNSEHGLDLDAVRRAVNKNTRALIVNTPNNPTGAMYPERDLRALVALAAENDFVIIADEAYEALTYDGARHVSAASLGKDATARVVTVQTFSKSFAMTGYRVGYLCAPVGLAQAVAKVHSHVTGNACTFAQYGALAALGLGGAHREEWRAAHQERRDLAYGLGSKLFDCVKPWGGLFLFADARRHLGKTFRTSSELAEHFLHKAGVATVPGSAFGREGFLRLSFSAGTADLREAFARMEKAL
ncbi:MAG: pyridoxal phosphate-dependent aminotransferase [Elusimicrobia bacterium]|nr:pyridoxal phosphate-dependent aminotransferase [Elusimicrobiota bacterium]